MKKLVLLLVFISSSFLTAQTLSWIPRGIGGGGALFSPSINPQNSNEYFVSCDMSELFSTNTFGQSYTQVDFRQLQGGHNSKVCWTSTPGLLYCINYDNDMAVPVKSTDGGTTWSALTGNPDNSEETFSIHVDWNNPSRVLISYYGEIFFSSNGGTSFSSIHTAANSGAGNIVGGVFFDGSTIYIGTNDGVLISTDAGATWNTASLSGIPSDERIFSFAAAKTGNTTRFFCLTGDVNDIYVGLVGSDYWGFMRGVYSCDYGSGNWVSQMTGITPGTDFPMYVMMAENDISTAYLAGSNASSYPEILKTTTGGALWSHVFNTNSNSNIVTGWSGQGGDRGWGYGECVFGVAVSATNPNVIVFSDFGFVHKSNDGGTTWQQAYVNVADDHPAGANTPPFQAYRSVSLENTTCWQVVWSDAIHLFAAFSDIRGIRSEDQGGSWSFDYTGHTANSMYRIAKHPSNGTLYAATSGIHDMYQSTRLQDNILDANDPAGKIIYSTDHGATWSNLHVFNHPVFWMTIDPSNPNRAYASVIHYNNGNGVGGIYRCDDLQNLAASTWTLLPDPPRTEKHPASIEVLNDGSVVCSYSGRRNGAGTFTASSGVFIYDPVGNSWTDVSDPGMYYWTKDVVIDPTDTNQNTWYAGVFSGWGGPPNGLGGLYKTTNRGTLWTRISNVDRVTSCAFDPVFTNRVFMTTEQDGLWVCNNINAPVPVFTQDSLFQFRQPERVFFNPYYPTEIWVTTFGNGLYSSITLTVGTATTTTLPIRVWPNPTSGSISLEWENEARPALLYDQLGRVVQRINLVRGMNVFELEQPAGIYYLVAGDARVKLVKE
jgi:hypothetical protein